MQKQIILSISREFGSGGHEIAEKLAKRFELLLLDSSLLKKISEQKNIDLDYLKKYDEAPNNVVLFRRVQGLSNSPEENVALLEFDYLKKLAEEGESFVVVGRCAEEVLKSFKGLISVFVLGDRPWKIERIAKTFDVSTEEAEEMLVQNDRQRKSYHNHYCDGKWGDSRNYDLCINSSRIGIDETVEVIAGYVQRRQGQMKE